jgi:hypothetical protein
MDISNSGDDGESRLHALENALRAMFGVKDRACPACGQTAPLRPASRMCRDCYARRQAEANRAYQRKRRRRERCRRRLAAGLVKVAGASLVEMQTGCAHCGTPFRPQRTTGRYCSTRCRVAAHRGKKQ